MKRGPALENALHKPFNIRMLTKSLLCKMVVSLILPIPLLWKNTLMKRHRGLAVEFVPVHTGKNNPLQHTSKTMLPKHCARLATISWSNSLNSLCKSGNLALWRVVIRRWSLPWHWPPLYKLLSRSNVFSEVRLELPRCPWLQERSNYFIWRLVGKAACQPSLSTIHFFFLTILFFDTNFFFIILPSKSFNKVEGQGLNYFSITNKPELRCCR